MEVMCCRGVKDEESRRYLNNDVLETGQREIVLGAGGLGL